MVKTPGERLIRNHWYVNSVYWWQTAFVSRKWVQARGSLHMLTSCTSLPKCKGSPLPLCLGIAWKDLLCFWSEWCCSELFNICFLTPLLLSTYALARDHKCGYRLKGHRHPFFFFFNCFSCSLESGDIHFSCPLGNIVGKKVFCWTVVSACVLFHKRKILRTKWRESGHYGLDCCPSHIPLVLIWILLYES